jgi:hypothetical protein
MGILATIVDTEALLDTVAVAVVAGVGITIVFSFAIYGATRFAEARRVGASLATSAAAGLMVVALVTCMAAITAGLVIIASD